MWLRHVGTGKVAPIDWWPVPGGNILIHGETYEVLVGDERTAMDPTAEDPDARPRLRMNHHHPCQSNRGRAPAVQLTDADVAPWQQVAPDLDFARRAAGERPDED
jgi:hypothetical protein